MTASSEWLAAARTYDQIANWLAHPEIFGKVTAGQLVSLAVECRTAADVALAKELAS